MAASRSTVSTRERRRERRAARRRRAVVRPLQLEEGLGSALDLGSPDLPLIQDLQRDFARPATRVLPRSPAGCGGHASVRRDSSAKIAAISMAAAAASHPLLDGPSTARASASSIELVVRTPNAIGTPVSPDASISPVRHGGRDEVEVRGLALDEAAETHDGMKPPALGGAPRGQRNLERAGHAHDRDRVAGSGRAQRRERAGLQPSR